MYLNSSSYIEFPVINAVDEITDNNSANSNPYHFSLSQNYPNPFNPVTVINFSIPVKGLVTLKVYDITGREVKTLVNDIREAGNSAVTFDGTNLSSGIYFYNIVSGNFTGTRKMILVK